MTHVVLSASWLAPNEIKITPKFAAGSFSPPRHRFATDGGCRGIHPASLLRKKKKSSQDSFGMKQPQKDTSGAEGFSWGGAGVTLAFPTLGPSQTWLQVQAKTKTIDGQDGEEISKAIK